MLFSKNKEDSGSLKDGFYFPQVSEFDSVKEVNIQIIDQKGSEKLSKYKESIGPFYWNVKENIDSETIKKILSNKKNKQSVIIGMPTYNSEDHIYKYLIGDEKNRDVLNQLKIVKEKHPEWDIELVVCITKITQEDKTENVVKKIQKEALKFVPSVNVTIINTPVRTKVNAMNVVAEYADKKGASILGFVDDDTLLNPKDALLKNIELLLAHEELSIITPKYYPGEPSSLWERMRTIRWRYHTNKSINGESMVLYVKSYPKIPYFLNSDDIYLTTYFLDLNCSNPFKNVIVNDKTYAQSRLAGNNILAGIKVLIRTIYGIRQLFCLIPAEKKENIKKLISGESILSTINKIKKRNCYLDLILLFIGISTNTIMSISVTIELFIRKTFKIPKKMISWNRDTSAIYTIK